MAHRGIANTTRIMVVHGVSLLLVLCAFYFSFPLNSPILWHFFFMILGLCGFCFQGVIIYNKHSSLAAKYASYWKYVLHGTLQALGLLSFCAGFAIIFKAKVDNNKGHMTTWHGCLGYGFVLYSLFQSFFGILKSRVFLRRWMKPGLIRKFHAISGAMLFFLGCVVASLGLRSDWFQKKALPEAIHSEIFRLIVHNVILISLGLLLVVALKQVYDKYWGSVEAAQFTVNTHAKKSKRSNK